MACPHCGGENARGTCPWSIACPTCRAGPGKPCKRPSRHGNFGRQMHAGRYRTAEKTDALACPGFEPIDTPHGAGCRHCSGLPEDHPNRTPAPARSQPARQLGLFSR